MFSFFTDTISLHRASFLVCASVLLLPSALGQNIPEIFANYGDTPAPFTLDVHPSFIATTELKVSLARIANDIGVPNLVDGPSTQTATSTRDFWVREYNWRTVQKELNENYTMFTTTVDASDSNYTEPVPLFFVHHRSPRSNAIPLLFIHGFPGSFMEVGRVISSLTNPPNDSVPAFHVVAPSLPGYGFSPAPVKPGMGPIEAAHALNALMHQLNYSRYVIQGGDLGGIILRYQAALFPDSVVSILSNFWIISPNATDIARYNANLTTPDETTYIRNLTNFGTLHEGYFIIQSTEPLVPGHAMTDSPLGWAMYMYQLMAELSPFYNFSLTEIITWAMMYIIQGPYPAMRFYKEFYRDGAIVDVGGFGEPPYVTVPVGVTQRPYDGGWDLPLDWAQRGGNITALYVHDFGGHFAAYETPDTLLDDCWRFWGDASISGTGEFLDKRTGKLGDK